MSPIELQEVVAKLRAQKSDDAFYEVKSCSQGLSKDVWETVSAFGNTKGGTLILGLDETSGFQPVSSFPLEKVLDQFVEGIGAGGITGKKVDNPPQYDIDRVDFEGTQVLVIALSEVEDRFKPCFITARGIANGAYKRVDDKDIKLSPTEVYELQHMLEVSAADCEKVAGAMIEDLNEDRVTNLIKVETERGSKALRGVRSREEGLRRLNVVDKDGDVTLAGIMGLGLYPQQFFPKLVIDVTTHPGIEKSEPDGPRFLDRVICEGPIEELVDDGLHAIAKNLRTFSFVEGSSRRDELEIPREVLREALANAVIHREYDKHFTGQAVSVDIYPDRVEIINPGGLWGGKTLETLADGQSRCRNASLMKLVSRSGGSENSAPAEGQGSGIPLMIREMRSRALDEPKFEPGIDFFRVVLWRSGTELSENREWLNQIGEHSLNRKQEMLLLEIRREGSCTVGSLHERLGYDSDEIRRLLHELVTLGMVVENTDDTYSLEVNSSNTPKLSTKEVILSLLSDATHEMSMREIAEASGKNINTLRAQMQQLVSAGLVVATAPATDRNRKYRVAQS